MTNSTKQGIVSKEQYDQSLATSTAAEATVHADEAAIQTAKIQLSYCSIYAPISGVTGAQLVYPGATVKANDVPVLVVINQVSPIYVDFSVPQQYLESIKTFMARSRLAVQATPPGDSAPEKGVLTFVNNTVDSTTGTIAADGFVSQHRPASLARPVLQCPAAPERAAERAGRAVAGRADGTAGRLRLRGETGHDRRRPASESGANRQQQDRSFAAGFPPAKPWSRTGRCGWFPEPRSISPRDSDEAGIAMNLCELFIRRPVMTSLVMLAILLFGILGYRDLAVSDLPNVDFPTIQVSAGLPGASPETMASSVATPLEKQFTTIAGLDSMTSTSSLGQRSDHPAVRSQPQHRLRRARRADGHLRGRQSASAQPALSSDLPESEPGRSGHLCCWPLPRRPFRSTKWTNTPKTSSPSRFPRFPASPRSTSTARRSTPCACS